MGRSGHPYSIEKVLNFTTLFILAGIWTLLLLLTGSGYLIEKSRPKKMIPVGNLRIDTTNEKTKFTHVENPIIEEKNDEEENSSEVLDNS